MPGIKNALEALKAASQAAKAPRTGYFSVLDELIGQLPDRPISTEELRQRLKPGRILQREDMQFPLKQEEINYALEPVIKDIPALARKMFVNKEAEEALAGKIHPNVLRNIVRARRPEFLNQDAANRFGDFESYSTQGPNKFDYFANITESPDFNSYSTHFTPTTLSFSRGSRHEIDPAISDEAGNLPESGGMLRLIDEIQNDRANAARSVPHDYRPDINLDAPFMGSSEKISNGWRTPEEQQQLDAALKGVDEFDREQIHRENPISHKVPDAPFKEPQDYGRLEIKNQLLNALDADDDYLGITPASGPASWFPGTGAKDTTYDKVYPGELRKLAKQYGAPFEKLPLPIQTDDFLHLPVLAGTDMVDFIGRSDWHLEEPLNEYQRFLDEIAPHRETIEEYDPRNGSLDLLDSAQEQLDRVRDMEKLSPPDEDGMRNISEDLKFERQELEKQLIELYEDTIDQQRGIGNNHTIRNIPAMRLTPEVKERIARIGLPLFTVAGAAAISPEMVQAPIRDDESMSTYAGGGTVNKATGLLKRVREGAERAGKAKADEQAWLRDLGAKKAANNALRWPVGRAANAGAGGYGAWAEKAAQGPAAAFRAPQKAPPTDLENAGTLSTLRKYLDTYAEGGSVSMAQRYPDAFEGQYEDGDEYLGEDDEFEYYACGGPVKLGLGGFLKKAVKKVGKVVGKVAKFVDPIATMINPGAGAILGVGGALLSKLTKDKPHDVDAVPEINTDTATGTDARKFTVPDMQSLQSQASNTYANAPTQLSMIQPQTMRDQPGSNAGGLLSQLQAMHSGYADGGLVHMGLGGLLKKVGKAIKQSTKAVLKMPKAVLKNPTRLLTGVDPLSTKITNKVLGLHNDPLVNVYGGPTAEQLDEVGAGSLARLGFKAADTIAGLYGGKALAGVGGKLLGSAGSTLGKAVNTIGSSMIDGAAPGGNTASANTAPGINT